MWRRLNSNWSVALVLCTPALYVFTTLSCVLPDATLLTPDSLSYIQFHPMRTLGYPILIRLMALVSENPGIFATLQLSMGLFAIIYMCEAAQRVIRNIFVTVPVGVFLITSWPLLEHSLILLSDYPFFSIVCLALGTFFNATRRPDFANVSLLVVFIGLASFIRPLGIVLLPLLVVVVLANTDSWRRVSLLSISLVVMVLGGQGLLNHHVFGYFGVSSAGGYSMAQNTAVLMTPQTRSETPELRDRVVKLAKPYATSILAESDSHKRMQRFNSLANQMIGRMGQLVQDYGFETKTTEYVNTASQVSFARRFKSISPLNTSLSSMPVYEAPQWLWTNRTLTTLAKEAHLANVGGWISWVALKFSQGWRRVVGYATMPRHGLKPYAVLDLAAPDLGAGTAHVINVQERTLLKPQAINLVPALLYKVGGFLIAPWIIGFTIVAISAMALRELVVSRKLTSQTAVFIGCAGFLVSYHLAVSIGQTPTSRFMLGSIAPAYFLLFGGLALFYTKAILVFRSSD